MKQVIGVWLAGILFWVYAIPAFGHFGMVIPSDNMIMPNEKRALTLQLSFGHPMEVVGMELTKPKSFNVVSGDIQTKLTSHLKPIRVMGQSAWQVDYPIRRPGVYTFYMEPQPYWESAEDLFIIHYTKTVVAAFGDDEGWDREIGLKTEIVPLSKPFGLYTGNVFQGIVKINGEPVPYAKVEVEYYNQGQTAQAPTDYMITQTIKSDQNGVFTYAVPKDGWWGFSALNEADFTLKAPSGDEKPVELGAVIWVHFELWSEK